MRDPWVSAVENRLRDEYERYLEAMNPPRTVIVFCGKHGRVPAVRQDKHGQVWVTACKCRGRVRVAW